LRPDGEATPGSIGVGGSPKMRLAPVVIVAGDAEADRSFADHLAADLSAAGRAPRAVILGGPTHLRAQLTARAARLAEQPPLFATLEAREPMVRSVVAAIPELGAARIATAPPRRWPTFLLPENLLNVANQIAVIAILAIGMTMVIITGGIDLSVGSLIALSAVATAGMVGWFGGAQASAGGMLLAALLAILMSGGIGAFSGLVIIRFQVPPFIATLGMMQVASGLAYILSRGKPIYQLPESFVTLGRGTAPGIGIPYAVLLMVALYLLAHLVMSRTTLGRYIYAVGGNAEAARLAGVRVGAVVLFVFATSGLLAGLGGVIMASQLRSGAPTYGLMYELYVIAAVVVGGTSLSGGEGRIFGTLIGALIIAVIQNGMNLTNVESYTQKVVLGLVILGAVLLDRIKHGGWFWQRRRLHPAGAAAEEGSR
ncbi:MAG: hypothetical protein GF330_10930, partial [Candidatus Eisenbacteria bacterium]|nr:hypothetical protein [Candidatus Eisenbacteria bacterium]